MRQTIVLFASVLLFSSPLACQQQATGDSTRTELLRALDSARASVAQVARALARYDSARVTTKPQPEPDRAPAAGLLHADDFERDEIDVAGAGRFEWKNPVYVSVSNERVRSGSRALKFTFGPLSATKSVTEQSRAQLNFVLPRSKEVWMEWYAYHPDGTERIRGVGAYEHGLDTPSNNKLFRLFSAGHYSDDLGAGASTSPSVSGAGGHSRVRLDYRGPEGDNWSPRGPLELQPVLIDLARDRGRWVRIRVQVRKSNGAANDGLIRLWKDGALLHEVTGLAMYDATGVHDYFDAGYLYGAANSGFPRETAIYVDDFKIYGSDPGWR